MMLDRRYVIKTQLDALNEHDSANRANKFGGANHKKMQTNIVRLLLNNQPAILKPCRIKFIWHISTKHDYDNIRFACKYVLDGMIAAKVLKNDNPTWIRGFDGDDFVKVKKGMEKIIVEVRYTNE